MQFMRILACQIDIPDISTPRQRDEHVAHINDTLLKEYRDSAGADLIVLPELSTISYNDSTFAELEHLSETLDGPSVQQFSKTARDLGVPICFGLPRKETGQVRISQLVVDAEGNVGGHYDKLHLAHFGDSPEKKYFSPGNHLCVFEAGGLRIAPIICYDFRFPDLIQTLCQTHHVDLILHPVAFSRDATFESWHSFVMTRAQENQVYFLSLNRAGPDFGMSIFSPPWVDKGSRPVVFDTRECFQIVETDEALVRDIRTRFPYRKDQLDDYQKLDVV